MGFGPMPSSAMRAAFITGLAKVESEKRGVVVAAALRAVPATIKWLGQGHPAKTEAKQQSQSANKIGQQPALNGKCPKCFAHAADVPSHQQYGKIAEPVQCHCPSEAQCESPSQAPKSHGDKRCMKYTDQQALYNIAAELVERQSSERGHLRDTFGNEPHLANREAETDGEGVADKVCGGDVPVDCGNEQWN